MHAFVDGLVKSSGPMAIGMIMSQKSVGKKWEGLLQLANAMHVKPPDSSKRSLKILRKTHERFAGTNRLHTDDIQVDALVLQGGFVKNSDDTDCAQITKVIPNASGIVLMKPQDARPWIVANEVISQDELAIAVVGQCVDDSKTCQKCQIPVTYNGDPLIIQACLHNLGAEHVPLQNDTHDEIPTHET